VKWNNYHTKSEFKTKNTRAFEVKNKGIYLIDIDVVPSLTNTRDSVTTRATVDAVTTANASVLVGCITANFADIGSYIVIYKK